MKALLTVCAAVMLAGCAAESPRTETPVRDAAKEAKEAADRERRELKARLQARIDELDRRLEESERTWDAKMKRTRSKAAAEWREQRDAAKRNLDKLQDATEDAWNKTKSEVEEAVDGLERAFDKAFK